MPKPLADHALELRTQGYTIVESVLTREQIDESNAALESIFDKEKDIGPGRGWHNNTYKVAYMLPQKHELFRRFCHNEHLLPLIQLLLGRSCVLASLNGLTMTTGGEGQGLHIDQNETVPGNVLYINALHCLDDFTRENGCTRVVPGSQDRVWRHKTMDREAIEKETVCLEAPAGSLIAYNGGLWHAGSQNRTDKPRRAIHAFFCRQWCRPQWDYTRSLTPDVVATLSEEQKRLFGFYAKPGWYDPLTHQEVRERAPSDK